MTAQERREDDQDPAPLKDADAERVSGDQADQPPPDTESGDEDDDSAA